MIYLIITLLPVSLINWFLKMEKWNKYMQTFEIFWGLFHHENISSSNL